MGLPITIVIPVSTDERIGECIESIDEDVETLVVLNNSSEDVEKIVKELSVSFCKIDKNNLGLALQTGIEHSKTRYVLLMDSDCVFNKGTIRKLYDLIDGYYLAKGKVLFRTESFFGKYVNKIREFTCTDEVNAYSPPLLIDKRIKDKIGGFFFCDFLEWEEDDEFNDRIKRNKIDIAYDPTAIIYHPQPTLLGDLRSAFRYGKGRRIGVTRGVFKLDIMRYLDFKVLWKKGILPFIYLLIWNISYYSGYLFQKYFNERKM